VQPDTGGRFAAVLIAEDASGARFRVELSTSAGEWSSEASVSASAGEVQWGAWSGSFPEPPDWLCRYLRAALRAAWRAHPEEGWPRRLTRWRDAPDARRTRDPDENG
jgi:hypothetical protein